MSIFYHSLVVARRETCHNFFLYMPLRCGSICLCCFVYASTFPSKKETNGQSFPFQKETFLQKLSFWEGKMGYVRCKNSDGKQTSGCVKINFDTAAFAQDNSLFLFLQNSNNIGYHPLVVTGTCYTPQFHQMFVHIV